MKLTIPSDDNNWHFAKFTYFFRKFTVFVKLTRFAWNWPVFVKLASRFSQFHTWKFTYLGSVACGTTPIYTVFRARRITFFLVNRVENQNEPKRPQGGGRLGSFWFSTRPTAMGGTDYNVLGLWDNLRSSSSICPKIELLIIISASVCRRPSWKLKRTQTATTLWPFGFVLVFNLIH